MHWRTYNICTTLVSTTETTLFCSLLIYNQMMWIVHRHCDSPVPNIDWICKRELFSTALLFFTKQWGCFELAEPSGIRCSSNEIIIQSMSLYECNRLFLMRGLYRDENVATLSMSRTCLQWGAKVN